VTSSVARRSTAMLYRLALDDSTAPAALNVSGAPVDQLSFKAEDEWLSVLVRSEAVGDGMWGAEVSAGDVGLLRVPMNLFSAGQFCFTHAEHFAALTTPASGQNRGAFQNRHVGDFILYGLGTGWGRPAANRDDAVYVYNRAEGGAVASLPLPHAVDRIEALGDDAVVVGNDGRDLYFSTIVLDTADPHGGGRIMRRNVTQGETRTHGFFFKPQSDGSGVLGLPIHGAPQPGWSHLTQTSASILYIRVANREFASLGELSARDGGAWDKCQASCTDWYGNARPIFYRGRVLALLGYELVEGIVNGQELTESARAHILPSARGHMTPVADLKMASAEAFVMMSCEEVNPGGDCPTTTSSRNFDASVSRTWSTSMFVVIGFLAVPRSLLA